MSVIIALFMLGIGNFAIHKAVLSSHHALLDDLPPAFVGKGGRVSLSLEFVWLLAAMLFAHSGWNVFAWIYGGYSVLNMGAGLLILKQSR